MFYVIDDVHGLSLCEIMCRADDDNDGYYDYYFNYTDDIRLHIVPIVNVIVA